MGCFRKINWLENILINMIKSSMFSNLILMTKKTVAAFRGMHVSPAESVTDGRTDRRTDGRTDGRTTCKVIPTCRFASQATQKVSLRFFIRMTIKTYQSKRHNSWQLFRWRLDYFHPSVSHYSPSRWMYWCCLFFLFLFLKYIVFLETLFKDSSFTASFFYDFYESYGNTKDVK